MITASYGLTSTERVLPKLALDFTTASLDSRVTFTRSGNTATVTNSSGYVAAINANLPRFDYNPITLVCNGLLIEESRTNTNLYSEQFNDVVYVIANASVTPNDTVSPDGTLNADKLVENTATGAHSTSQNINVLTSTVYTFSIFAKAAGRTSLQLRFSNPAVVSAPQALIFNLSTGTISSWSGTPTGTITNFGNGWYRCTITGPATIAAGALTTAARLFNGSDGYTGDGVSGMYLWGAQLEAGAFATSYIPTVASTVTRNADVATMTGANFSDWWYISEGAAVVQALPSTISGTRPSIQFDDNTANESIALRGVAADPQLFVVDGGSPQATLDAGTITANTVYKLGGAWKASSFATAINGATAVTSASGTLPTVTQARLGSDGTNYFNGHLQNLRYWPQRLTNSEVQAFSK